MRPFRWNLKKEEQLGKLLDGERAVTYDGFYSDLRACAARVVAFSDDSRLVFVGRSPENLFDYLSGVFVGTAREEVACHLNLSNRYRDFAVIREEFPRAYKTLCQHFAELDLTPTAIIAHSRPTCLVDLVASGGTLCNLYDFLSRWCQETAGDLSALNAKLRVVGITRRTKTSPNTWRWQQTQGPQRLDPLHSLELSG